MPTVFVSYRRADSSGTTGRLCDRLKRRFGSGHVFVDIDDIPLGAKFGPYIRQTIHQCDAVLAVIGPNWEAVSEGRSRLNEPEDFIRQELAIAFEAAVPVFPILVGETLMPEASRLPTDIRGIVEINAAPLDEGRDFHTHTDRIIAAIEGLTVEAIWYTYSSSGGTSWVEYRCKSCKFEGTIEKPDWFRDGVRPVKACPKCSLGEWPPKLKR